MNMVMVKQKCILCVFIAVLHYYIVSLDWVFLYLPASCCQGRFKFKVRQLGTSQMAGNLKSALRTLDGKSNAVAFGDSKSWEIMRRFLWSSGFVWIKVDLKTCIQKKYTAGRYHTVHASILSIIIYPHFIIFIHMHLGVPSTRGTTGASFGWRQWFLLGTLEGETCWSSNKVDQTYSQHYLIIWYMIWQYDNMYFVELWCFIFFERIYCW